MRRLTFQAVSDSSPALSRWLFTSWHGRASRLPFLGRQEDFAGAHREPSRSRIEVEFPRHLRHDPQLLKILFAENRNVRPALMIQPV